MSRTMTNTERERCLADLHVGMISIAEDGRGPLIVPSMAICQAANSLC
jgi:hypothetical protein